MDEDIIEKAKCYAAQHAKRVSERLGFGIHGSVFTLEGNSDFGASAVKIIRDRAAFFRECDTYERLREHGVFEVCGFHVPQLLSYDEALLAVEMTVVKPPFVLDFAGAYLDWPPKFSDEVWDERRAKWADEFGDDWPMVQRILSEFEDMGIYMLDPSPANIRFR